ncbi:MAG: hypothetical protein HKN21_09345 [Candidatus Eisenbacteria bacterium]|uniref:PEP-CTERM sorting domain-containing protein n=1 Tax=Eiseniibacteriota bacterium TaxID=2212470 RepID=A0A7Y2H2Q0_UNCEI|nr:hypothetical protein [Candidatus Eisenbacteria bacterium]
MKLLLTTLVIGVALTLTFAVPAQAADPVPGTYTSIDIGFGSQDVLTGRGSNSRPVPDLGIDNVFNTMSWDGATLGTQWNFQCAVSTSQTTTNNLDANGNGTILFETIYTGGTFWFSMSGPWSGAAVDLTGTVNTTIRNTTLQYVNFVPVAAVENVSTSGAFDGSGCVLDFVINNTVGLGDTDSNPPLPADYPPFLDTACQTGVRTSGSWGDIRDIILAISCPTAVEPKTWGGIKQIYN